ncbi:sigma-70 family RNA polymerase sigma factor [Pigmentiphaga aceris]|uniref:Sigma-70 family RNA polymerase sigma factor n=1 Tax=Pigmentiphaga aceris TaxID=1940612 RepID=A0A5C0ARS8_9BURK|nr:sigma-70 family RNA polymerase sigma factor [Pigmentiphaga aceris]QEI04685.1 sigma-70 family RNA polymerase sigma factor [Pigmentiphaga aceris]
MHPGLSPTQDPLGAMYRAHYGWLAGWLRKKLGCTAQAADLAQDTFMRVLVSQEATTLREPRAYLGTIAHGLMVNHLRRRDLERSYLEALATLPEPLSASPEEQALALEALYQVDAMLDTLPTKVRQAFLMAQFDGMSYADIATALGVSDRMVRKYMAQAMLACLLLDNRS